MQTFHGNPSNSYQDLPLWPDDRSLHVNMQQQINLEAFEAFLVSTRSSLFTVNVTQHAVNELKSPVFRFDCAAAGSWPSANFVCFGAFGSFHLTTHYDYVRTDNMMPANKMVATFAS